MLPSPETIKDPSHLHKLGSGLYAVAYRQEDGTVLKISKGLDGSMDYIEWCCLRMKKYGKGSFEMVNFPEVEHFGRSKVMKKNAITGDETEVDGWWAVMPEYIPSWESPAAKLHNGICALYDKNGMYKGSVYADEIKQTLAFIERHFGWDCLDIHDGNVMWDDKRGQWVVTDPSADNATGTAASIPQHNRFKQKNVASWKRTPLQCLAQRR